MTVPELRVPQALTSAHHHIHLDRRAQRRAATPIAVRALRHRLVAILYSQVRSEARSSVNPPMPCQAASIVSWTASSASAKDPSIR
jgi:hypothetical protein